MSYILVWGGVLPHIGRKHFRVFNVIRYFACRLLFDYIGSGVDIGKGIRFSYHVSLGKGSSIGDYAYISGQVLIGEYVMMAPKCSFIAMNHQFDEENPLKQIESIKAPINIKDYVWLGYGSIILAGVTIGEGTIVGAGAVVTEDVPPFSVVGGVPARVIKYRK